MLAPWFLRFMVLFLLWQGSWTVVAAKNHMDSTESIYLRTALWDVREKAVAVTADIHGGMETTITGCIFRLTSQDSTPNVSISSNATVKALFDNSGFLIRCVPNVFLGKGHSTAFLDASVNLTLSSGASVGPVTAEIIGEALVGDLVMCFATLFSHTPELHRWLDHYRVLGVDLFRLYYVILGMNSTFGGYNSVKYGGPITTFDGADIIWHAAASSHHMNIFSKNLYLTDCLLRYRYSFRYLICVDTDEFLVLNASLPGYPKLARILDNGLPETVAYVRICRWHYSRYCSRNKTLNAADLAMDYASSGFFSHWKRDQIPACGFVKSVIRPAYVDVMWHHWPMLRDQAVHHDVITWPANKGFIQHWSSRVRENDQFAGNLTDCDNLGVQNETFISQTWFV